MKLESLGRWFGSIVCVVALGFAGCESGGESTHDAAAGGVQTEDVPLDEGPADAETDTVEPDPDPVLPMRAAGWMAGDLHMHTLHSDGDDPVGIVIALAKYLSSETFLAAHPEYRGNPIDFISLTDHRTVAQNEDPEFVSTESLIVMPGEEWGGPGHANIWGLSEFITHDRDGDGQDTEDARAAVDAAHVQGAVFSMNHPMLSSTPFPWDVRTHDGVEVWNAGWGLWSTGYTAEALDAWEVGRGATAGPAYRSATRFFDEGACGQALRLYEAQLSMGIHVAVVGGSDRHMLFPVGFPTTWVHGESRDMDGILDGIRARHTFVSRTPVSATVEMAVVVGDKAWVMGDRIAVPAGGVTADVTVRVRRAQGARVRLMRGSFVGEAAIGDATLGQVAFEVVADSRDFEVTTTLDLAPGDWVYPVVHEPLIGEDMDPALAAKIPAMIEALGEFSEEDYTPLVGALIDYIDLDVLFFPWDCNPATWNPEHLQCLPVDDYGMATYFFPDWINAVINVLIEDGAPTDWAMGAVGSAVMCEGPSD